VHERAKLVQRVLDVAAELLDHRDRACGIAPDQLDHLRQPDPHRNEALLSAIVQVAGDPTPQSVGVGGVLGVGDPLVTLPAAINVQLDRFDRLRVTPDRHRQRTRGSPCRDGALPAVVCAFVLRGDGLVMARVASLVRVGPHAGFLIRHGL